MGVQTAQKSDTFCESAHVFFDDKEIGHITSVAPLAGPDGLYGLAFLKALSEIEDGTPVEIGKEGLGRIQAVLRPRTAEQKPHD